MLLASSGADASESGELGRRSAELLEEMKGWMANNNAAIMAVLLLVIGAKLIGDGINGLTA